MKPRRLVPKRVRRFFSQGLAALAHVVVPHLYVLYMRLVWYTSRIQVNNAEELKRVAAQHDGAVALLWHEEVFTVAYGYYYLGLRGHTLASAGEAGELIARMLQLCNYVVFRGGSTTSKSRRRSGVLEDMIEHMKQNREVIYGLTVDGSKGPPYRMKTGGIIIARECNKPIVLMRTWYKHCIRLPTWDRMAIPLPFNVIGYFMKGPYHVPAAAHDNAGLEHFRNQLEDDLIDLAAHSYDAMKRARPANLRKRTEEITPAGDHPAPRVPSLN